MTDIAKTSTEAPVVSKDEALAHATALTDEAFIKIGQQEYDDAINLSSMALEKMVTAYGELAFETSKFYYFLADALLSKIESSTEVLNDPAAVAAGAAETAADAQQKLMNNGADMVREMFEQMAKANEAVPSTTASTEKPSEVAPDTSAPVEAEKPVPKAQNLPDSPTEK